MVHAEGAVEKERKEWIDIARAIAIFLVVLSHVERKGMITDYTAAGGVAVFFFLSGYVYRAGEKAGEFWKKKAVRIFIPYLVVGLFSILVYNLLGGIAAQALKISIKDVSFPMQVFHLLWGNSKKKVMKWNESLWFVPCFLCILLLERLTDHLTKEKWQRILAVVVYFTVGTLITECTKIYLPWQMETALHAYVFFAAGRGMRYWIDRRSVEDLHGNTAFNRAEKGGVVSWGVLCIFCFLISLFLLERNISIDSKFSIRMDQYPNYIYSFGIMFLVILWVFLLSWILTCELPDEWKHHLSAIGKCSYDIMLWNKFPVLALQVLLPKILPGISGLFMENDSIQGLTAASAGAVFCILLCLVWIRICRSILLRLQ